MAKQPLIPFSSWKRWGLAGLLLFPIAAAIGLTVGYFGGEQRGWIAGLLVGSLIALIRVSWPLRAKSWFWVAVAVFGVADIFAVSLVDWSFTADWNGHSMSGLAMLDFGAMMGIIYGLYRLNYGAPTETFQEDAGDLSDYAERDLDI